jgi:hypothetical protein
VLLGAVLAVGERERREEESSGEASHSW